MFTAHTVHMIFSFVGVGSSNLIYDYIYFNLWFSLTEIAHASLLSTLDRWEME